MKCLVCKKTIFNPLNRNRRFCGRPCFFVYSRKNPNKGCFKKGQTTWNKGISVRHSPKSEFKKGNKVWNTKPVGSIYLTAQGRYEIKIAHPAKWKKLARHVWESNHGEIPDGMLIHHIDGNCLNDKIENLELMTRAEHLMVHKKEFEHKRKRLASLAIKKRWKRVKMERSTQLL